MPLHLLAKKSWNVYNPANIARVRADEAAAAAREEAEEQRMQEADAERRIAILRGVTPPPLPSAPTETLEAGHKRDRPERRDKDASSHDRKRRRLRGEDDTDRDIRLAQATTVPREEKEGELGVKGWKPKVAADAPVVDHKGHISLFPVDEKAELQKLQRERKGGRDDKMEREKRKKEREEEEQSGMRFKDAGGRGAASVPWYSVGKKEGKDEIQPEDELLQLMQGKNIWGNEDPRRKDREKKRISSSDPLVIMQQAQAQLKQAKRDRKAWEEAREREIRELRAQGEREGRRDRHGKRKRHREEDRGRGFSLDSSSKHESRRRDEEKSSKHRRRRSRSRSKERPERRSSPHIEYRPSRNPDPGNHHRSRRHGDGREPGEKRYHVEY